MNEELQIWQERRRGLRRFREAQDAYGWDEILGELCEGRKQGHWIWFVFPQGKGLGTSRRSRVYALSTREARRYVRDPILGERLRNATRAVAVWTASGEGRRSIEQVLGSELDAKKFMSCMGLFYDATGENLWHAAVRWADGVGMAVGGADLRRSST